MAKKISKKTKPVKKSGKKKPTLQVLNRVADLIEFIRRTSTEMPEDVSQAIIKNAEKELKNTTADYAMQILQENIRLAKAKSQPLCQDTGTVLFYIDCPIGFDEVALTKDIHKAVRLATKKGYLRQNSVDSLTGKSEPTNVGPGAPVIHFHQQKRRDLRIHLMLKGGGCENVGAQYSLPDTKLGAGRDLEGVRKCVLDAVQNAQGRGCSPGTLGVCIGGDRSTGYEHAKFQLLRRLDDKNSNPTLAALEKRLLQESNSLGVGPMGFGGQTTLLGCKISTLNRLPASFYVSISYICWSYRRRGCTMNPQGGIKKWLI